MGIPENVIFAGVVVIALEALIVAGRFIGRRPNALGAKDRGDRACEASA
jgi:hypothetical protein